MKHQRMNRNRVSKLATNKKRDGDMHKGVEYTVPQWPRTGESFPAAKICKLAASQNY